MKRQGDTVAGNSVLKAVCKKIKKQLLNLGGVNNGDKLFFISRKTDFNIVFRTKRGNGVTQFRTKFYKLRGYGGEEQSTALD